MLLGAKSYDTIKLGKLLSSGAQVLIDTDGVPPGSYHVTGHATAEGRHP